jgi:hypothetical protein
VPSLNLPVVFFQNRGIDASVVAKVRRNFLFQEGLRLGVSVVVVHGVFREPVLRGETDGDHDQVFHRNLRASIFSLAGPRRDRG